MLIESGAGRTVKDHGGISCSSSCRKGQSCNRQSGRHGFHFSQKMPTSRWTKSIKNQRTTPVIFAASEKDPLLRFDRLMPTAAYAKDANASSMR